MASARSRARLEASICFTGDLSRFAVGLEFLQASGDDLRQVALLVALGNLDRFVDLAFAQGAGNGGSERARLLAGSAVRPWRDRS